MDKKLTIGLLIFCVLIVFAFFDVPRVLVYGWISFLFSSLYFATVNWNAVMLSFVLLVCFIFGFHILGSWFYRSRKNNKAATGWRFRWTLSGTFLLFLMFMAGIASIGIIHQTGWLISASEPFYADHVGSGKYVSIPPAASARESENKFNMKNIGFAILNYNDTFGELPSGGTFDSNGNALHSWVTPILTNLVYQIPDFDENKPWNHPENQKYFQSILPEFINPEFRTPPLYDANGYGLSHYAANSRVFYANSEMKFKDITSGLGNTIFMGEVNTGFKAWGNPTNWRDPAKGFGARPDQFGGVSSSAAKFLMGDGSVRTINRDIDPQILKALASPNSESNR